MLWRLGVDIVGRKCKVVLDQSMVHMDPYLPPSENGAGKELPRLIYCPYLTLTVHELNDSLTSVRVSEIAWTEERRGSPGLGIVNSYKPEFLRLGS